MTQMENRIVLCRFKDGYGPVGAYFLHLKTYTQNANGENYEKKWYEQTKKLVGEYIDHHPTPTCLRNHAFVQEVMAGRGPIQSTAAERLLHGPARNDVWTNCGQLAEAVDSSRVVGQFSPPPPSVCCTVRPETMCGQTVDSLRKLWTARGSWANSSKRCDDSYNLLNVRTARSLVKVTTIFSPGL